MSVHHLQMMKESGLKTIAFDCIHSEDKGYPTEAGSHIAIRTVMMGGNGEMNE